MPAYVVANVRVQDPDVYERYKQMVGASVACFGGRYLARGGRAQVFEGNLESGRVIVLEFPTYENAEHWYSSAEYAAAKQLRHECALSDIIIVEGL